MGQHINGPGRRLFACAYPGHFRGLVERGGQSSRQVAGIPKVCLAGEDGKRALLPPPPITQ